MRVALLDDSGTIAQYLTYGYVGSGPGTVAELARSSDCPATDPCVATARVLFELPDPAPGEALTVSGEIVSTASYPSMQTPSHTLGTVSRLASGVEMAAPEIRSALVRGDTVTLDAAHPIALQKIRLHLDPGKDLDPHLAVSGAELSLDPESLAGGNIGMSVYPAGPVGRAVRANLLSTGPVLPAPRPFAGCMAAAICDVDYVVRLAWMGPATGSQRVSWSLEPFIAGYGAAGLADDVKVTGTATPAQTVRDDAPFFSRTYEGRLELTSGTRDGRARDEFYVRLSGLRAEAGKDVAERPGIAMLTYKAVGRDGPVSADEPPVRLLAQNLSTDADASGTNVYVGVEEFRADGLEHSVALQLLTDCKPDADCEVLHLFTLFSPTGRASLPITVQWKLEVRATSFDSTPFGPEADITFTPRVRN